jgi:hypothetical protein
VPFAVFVAGHAAEHRRRCGKAAAPSWCASSGTLACPVGHLALPGGAVVDLEARPVAVPAGGADFSATGRATRCGFCHAKPTGQLLVWQPRMATQPTACTAALDGALASAPGASASTKSAGLRRPLPSPARCAGLRDPLAMP